MRRRGEMREEGRWGKRGDEGRGRCDKIRKVEAGG